MSAWAKRPILDIITEHVDLEEKFGESGTYYVGLCPFHEDTRPSFYVYPNETDEDSVWVCYSGADCGKGDVIDFVRKFYSMDFNEARRIATNEADPSDVAIAQAKKNYATDVYDFLLLSMRLHILLQRLDFAAARKVFFRIDQAAEAGDYSTIDRMLLDYEI